ncbi:MAG: GGDEF domain-containing protein [Thiobacillaceae bacterium]|nr:GGDEF domain-containing protein [Thiobacillaceae bacterium]
MAQTPNVIGMTVMQRLKETGEPPTPENYERLYYEISGLPRPAKPTAQPAAPVVTEAPPPLEEHTQPGKEFVAEMMGMLRQMLQEVTDKTATLAKDIGEKNKDLSGNVTNLKSSRDKNEILRLLSTVVMQAGGIQHTVEASHKDLVATRQALTSMQEELAETRQLLNEDALTGALNRRGLDQTLMREIARAQRLGVKLSLAMVDLDFFKKVNDQHGHEAGDQMLVHFAGLIKAVLRKSDALVRYGGEEFTLILPDTDARGAHFVLARLQQLMGKSPLVGHALLRRADEALYLAKDGGRNAIKVAA